MKTKNERLLAILTPTYNREKLLKILYLSLCKQTDKRFVWYVVDDGSQDNTKSLVDDFIAENKIVIKYFHKENGGKHTALNIGIKNIDEPLTIIVDSDDKLDETAVETILNDYKLIENEQEICGISYLKKYASGQVVGDKFTQDGIVEDFINQRYNKNVGGDKCEVFKTSILKAFPFPEFEGEKFLAETIVWCNIAEKYKMLFLNKAFYVCEYQEGGLSDGIKKRLFLNPQGSVLCYKILSGEKFKFSLRMKYTFAYNYYSFAGGKKLCQIFKDSSFNFFSFCFLLPSYLYYKKMRRKFKK